jgi:hypothetical protein
MLGEGLHLKEDSCHLDLVRWDIRENSREGASEDCQDLEADRED